MVKMGRHTFHFFWIISGMLLGSNAGGFEGSEAEEMTKHSVDWRVAGPIHTRDIYIDTKTQNALMIHDVVTVAT